MLSAVDKPFRSLTEQAELLSSRDLEVGEVASAERTLHRLNYYRVSGYGRQFQNDPANGGNAFAAGTSLDRLVELMDLDARLRMLLHEALTAVEIGVRSRFAYEAGLTHGSLAFYLDEATYFDITPDLPQHIAKIRRDLMRPKLRTVARYRIGDDDLSEVPIWVAIEVITFGALAKMMWYFQDTAPTFATADSLSLARTSFTSTIHSFAVMRNVCAHHGQIWHRRFDIQFATLPKEKRREPKFSSAGAYAAIVALKRFLAQLEPGTDWALRVDELVNSDREFRDGLLFPSPK
jgi:abortive infection bacteriophage resistance protein